VEVADAGPLLRWVTVSSGPVGARRRNRLFNADSDSVAGQPLRSAFCAAGRCGRRVEISRATRELSQRESIDSSRSGRRPAAGSICVYETPSELGSIAVIFPDRRGPLRSRSEPPSCGAYGPTASAGSSPHGGVWISGGSGSVCVGPDLLVWVSVQEAHQRRATDAATGVANAILRRLRS
jgi:hypothetical protein